MATLRDKFFGTIAGCHIGSSMGAVVEGMTYQKIVDKYGYVVQLYSYEHYGNGWVREPGTTEDGVERQKLMITAIMEKKDRVTAEDVKNSWLNHMNPNAAGTVSEPFEGILLKMAQAGIPGKEIGRYCDYAGLNSFARSCHAIGLINAGNVETAIEDIFEVGQLYQTPFSRGLRWACVTGVAIAAGTKPDATVDSVIGAIVDNCDKDMVVREIERELKNTQSFTDIMQMREYFDGVYAGKGLPYAMRFANEVVTKAVCIFKMVKGNTKEAILGGVNIGRDTDCIAAVTAGISGALTGGGGIPEEWINQVDKAVKLNKHTNTQRTLRENSDGLYDAFTARLDKMKAYCSMMSE